MSGIERDKIAESHRIQNLLDRVRNGQTKKPEGVGAIVVDIHTGEARRIDPESDECLEWMKNLTLQDPED